MWQQNLFNNLLVAFILFSLVVTIYCKMAKKTLLDLVRDIRGALSDE